MIEKSELVNSGSEAEYWEKRLSEKWGLHGVGHISYGRAYNKYLYRVRKHVFLRTIRSLGIRFAEADVLDVGSGTGFWIEVWKSLRVKSVTGSDITHFAVENLGKQHPGVEFMRFDLSEAKNAEDITRQYDLISAIDVMFHITSDVGFGNALQNCANLLTPGGYLIFSENFVHNNERRGSHQVSRTLVEIIENVKSKGLRIIKRVPLFVLMNTPLDTRSSTPSVLWRMAMAPVTFVPSLGEVYGAVLFPLELLLTRILNESPTTELVICQRIEE